MIPVMKKSGKVRICVDLKRLNQAVKRDRYMLPTLEEIAPQLDGAILFLSWMLPVGSGRSHFTNTMQGRQHSSPHLGDSASIDSHLGLCPLLKFSKGK